VGIPKLLDRSVILPVQTRTFPHPHWYTKGRRRDGRLSWGLCFKCKCNPHLFFIDKPHSQPHPVIIIIIIVTITITVVSKVIGASS